MRDKIRKEGGFGNSKVTKKKSAEGKRYDKKIRKDDIQNKSQSKGYIFRCLFQKKKLFLVRIGAKK